MKKVGKLRMAATPQDCQDIFRKDASLANPLTSDARSVMLRIPLPEDDGFALAVQVGCFAREPCVKGQRDRRDEGFELQPQGDCPMCHMCPMCPIFFASHWSHYNGLGGCAVGLPV